MSPLGFFFDSFAVCACLLSLESVTNISNARYLNTYRNKYNTDRDLAENALAIEMNETRYYSFFDHASRGIQG